MRVVLIGSGNTATVLGRAIQQTEHEVVQVFGRSEVAAKQLASLLDCDYTLRVGELTPDADLYIVAITDQALASISATIELGRKLVVHTAGSVPADVLKTVSTNYGVLYPLQSLRKEMNYIPELPLLIDANSPESLALIEDFAKSISTMVYKASDRQRESIHVAAVIVSNFTNHLYTLAADYCKKRDLDFMMLSPLISEVANRLRTVSPAMVQTGPAVRHDQATINKHLEQLQDMPQLQQLYETLTEAIGEYYKK